MRLTTQRIAAINNEWIYTSVPAVYLHCLHKDNFASFLSRQYTYSSIIFPYNDVSGKSG
jgi:hypothetical protein